MADSIEIEPMGTGEQTVTEPANQETIIAPEPVVDQAQRTDEVPIRVIWTPRFIVIFALILVVGLSADSLLVQARDNGYLAGNGILLAHLIPILSCGLSS